MLRVGGTVLKEGTEYLKGRLRVLAGSRASLRMKNETSSEQARQRALPSAQQVMAALFIRWRARPH